MLRISKKFRFRKIFKIHENYFLNPQEFVLLFYRRENAERLSNNYKLKMSAKRTDNFILLYQSILKAIVAIAVHVLLEIWSYF